MVCPGNWASGCVALDYNRNPTGIGGFKAGAEWRGNAGGRAKPASFASVLRTELDKLHAGTTNRQAIAAKAVQLALKGNLDAMKWIADRTDGKVPERLEVPTETAELLDDVLRLEILAYAARRRALAGSED